MITAMNVNIECQFIVYYCNADMFESVYAQIKAEAKLHWNPPLLSSNLALILLQLYIGNGKHELPFDTWVHLTATWEDQIAAKSK